MSCHWASKVCSLLSPLSLLSTVEIGATVFFCFAQAAAAAECRIQRLAICFAEWNWAWEPCSTMIFLTESRSRRERSNYQTRGGGTEAKGAKRVCRHLLFLRPGREYARFRWRNFRWRSFWWWELSVTKLSVMKLSVMKLSVKRCAIECQEKILSLCWANSLTKILWRMLLMSNWSTWPLSL